MSIYLTKYATVCTEKSELLSDIAFPQRVHWLPELFKNIKSGLVYVPHKLIEKVCPPEIISYLRENPSKKKSAFLLAAGSESWGDSQKADKESCLTYKYKMPTLVLTQIYAGRLAQQFGIKDYIATDASACASGLKVLMDVQTLMKFYGFDRVVVLATEDQINNATLEFFGIANASLLHRTETEKGTIPSAFDSKNGGFYVGQGAAMAVFESEDMVDSTGTKPFAKLVSAYSSSEDSTNAIGQRQDGQGYRKAYEGAFELGKVNPEEIAVVKTHGTGTESNNVAEKAALEGLNDRFVATSFKARIGHTLAASGLLETLLLLENMRNGFVPEIPNRTETDLRFLSAPVEAPKGLVLSLAAGMGNIYSAAVFEPMGA